MVDAFGHQRVDVVFDDVCSSTPFVEGDTPEEPCMASLLNSLRAGHVAAAGGVFRAAENPWLLQRQNFKGAQFVEVRSEVRERASRQHRECPEHQNGEARLWS
jgi:hypothetical protein